MPGPIAEAFVALRPDFAKFDSELKSGLADAQRAAEKAGEGIEDSFVEAARQSADAFNKFGRGTYADAEQGADKAGRAIEDEFKEAARDSEKALKGINFKGVAAGLAGLFAGVQIGSFLKDSTLDAQRLNSAMANTAQIIEVTGGVAGITADQIRSSSQELSLLTGTAAVDIQEASNVLLTFKNVGVDAFGRAQAAALDMGAVLGTDASGAAIQLGKALNDPVKGITALARAGVTFTEEQKAQIAAMQEAGDIAGAQNIILGELESQMGGTAAASADSTAKIGAAFTALKEAVGQGLIGAIDALTPAIVGIVDALGPVATQLGDVLGEALMALMPAIESLLGGLAPLFEVLGALVPVIAPIADLFASVLVTAIETLAAVVVPLLDALAPLAEMLSGALAGALSEVAPIFREVGEAIGSVLLAALEAVIPIFEALLPVIVSLLPIFGEMAGVVADTLVQAFEILAPVIEELLPIFVEIAEIIGQALSDGMSAALGDLAAVFLEVLDAVAPLLPILAGGLLFALETLEPILPVLVEGFIAMKVATAAWTVAQAAFNAVMAINPLVLIAAALVAVGLAIYAAYQKFEGFRNVVDSVWQAMQAFWDFLSGQFVSLWQGTLAPAIQTVIGAFQSLWENLEPVRAFLADAFGVAVSLVVGYFTAWWDAINLVIGVATALWEALEPVRAFIADALGVAIGVVVGYFQTWWSAVNLVVDVISSLASVLSEAFAVVQSVVETVVGAVVGALSGLVSGIAGVWESIRGAASTAWEAIKGAIVGVVETLVGAIIGPIEGVRDTVAGVWEAMSSFASEVWGNIAGFVSGGIDDIVGFVGGLPSRIASAAAGAFDSIWEGFKSAVNLVIDGINSINLPGVTIGGWDPPGPGPTIPSFTTPSLDPFPYINRLAMGGITTGPMLAMIGDNRSGREAVVPLERMEEFGFGGGKGDTIIQFNGGQTFQDATDADLVAQRTMAALTVRMVA